MSMPFFVTAFECQTHEYRRQVGKDISLDKGHQQLDQVDKDRQQDKEWRRAPPQRSIHSAKHKDQDDKAQDDDMPRDHVGKKTNDKRERLCKDSQDLYRDHDRLDPQRHGRVEDVQPVVFTGAEHDDEKSKNAEGAGESDIPDHISRPRYEPDQGIDQDKEKHGQQERHVFFIPVTKVDLPYFVAEKDHDRFDHALNTGRRRLYPQTRLVFFSHAAHDPDQQDHGDQHLHHIPANGKVIYFCGGIDRAIRIHRHDLTIPVKLFVEVVGCNKFFRQQSIPGVGNRAMLPTRSHEYRPATLRAVQDHRKRDGSDLAVKREEMKFVAVRNMIQDNGRGIDLSLGARRIKKKHTNYAESRYQ